MKFISANNIIMHYAIAGAGNKPCLVFLNSLGTDLRIWDDVIAHLGENFTTLCYDMRGHGLSGGTDDSYTIALLAQDLIALLDELSWKAPVIFAGLSVGGLIAQYIGSHYHHRTAGLFLMDTAAKIGTTQSWNSRIDAVRKKGIAAISNTIMERWFTPGFAKNLPVDYAGWSLMLERTSALGYAATCAALRDADLSTAAATITCPVAVVVGDQDASTSPELVKKTAALFRQASFNVIAGAGHLPCIEQPEQLSLLIKHFATTI